MRYAKDRYGVRLFEGDYVRIIRPEKLNGRIVLIVEDLGSGWIRVIDEDGNLYTLRARDTELFSSKRF